MAPWLRVDKQMVDIEGIDSITLHDEQKGETSNHWDRPPCIWLTYGDGREKRVLFETDEAARSMYESLFKLLMPEVAQALQEHQNGG